MKIGKRDYIINQPFFSFHTKKYRELLIDEPFTAVFYDFTTEKKINRDKYGNIFMICVPDGCVDVVFIKSRGKNRLEIIGTPFCSKSLIVFPDAQYFGVRFQPGFFFPIRDKKIDSFTDTETFILDVPKDYQILMEKIFECSLLEQKKDLMLEFIERFSKSDYMVDEIVQETLRLISISHGNIDIKEISEMLSYSERHLTRLFTGSLGYSPKTFVRIVRFQYALEMMITNAKEYEGNLSDYIEKLGYSDQAHFQREFKEFTSLTPKNFLKLLIEHN